MDLTPMEYRRISWTGIETSSRLTGRLLMQGTQETVEESSEAIFKGKIRIGAHEYTSIWTLAT